MRIIRLSVLLLVFLVNEKYSPCTLSATTLLYSHDKLPPLTKADYGNCTTQQFTYDSVGNRQPLITTAPVPPFLSLKPVLTPTTLTNQVINCTVESGTTVTTSLNSGAPQNATISGTTRSYVITGFVSGINNIEIAATKASESKKYLQASLTNNAPTLTVALSGTGGGTVTSSPAGISCTSGTCANTFNINVIDLRQTAQKAQ